MTHSANKFTHTLWAGAKQPGWMHREPEDQGEERLIKVGEGWIGKDNTVHLRMDGMPIEDTFTGYLVLAPRGKQPVRQDVTPAIIADDERLTATA